MIQFFHQSSIFVANANVNLHLYFASIIYFSFSKLGLPYYFLFTSSISNLKPSSSMSIPEHDNLLSNHLLSTNLQLKSAAISFQYYPDICYQTHLLSTLLRSHLFAIKPHLLSILNCYRHICFQASLAIRLTCYQSSVAINNLAINHHLPSNFRLALNPYFY